MPLNTGDFGVFGPDNVCLLTGNVIEQFSAGGEPETDFYSWQVVEPDGISRNFQGGGQVFQILSYTFSKPGDHTIRLNVKRGTETMFQGEKVISVVKGPTILLKESYALCPGQTLDVRVLDPNSPDFDKYVIEWRNEAGEVLEDIENELTINQAGIFTVRYFFLNSEGEPECENLVQTTVTFTADIELIPNAVNFCPGGVLRVSPSLPASGAWFIQKGNAPKVFLRNAGNLVLGMNDLQGFGDYTLIFEIPNPSNPTCIVREELTFRYNTNPAFEVEVIQEATDCFTADGILQIKALTDIHSLSYVIDEDTNSPAISLQAGEIYLWENLISGVYTFEGFLDGCRFTNGAFVPLADIPDALLFEVDPDKIVPETCNESGKNNGSFIIEFKTPPQQLMFELYNERGDLVLTGKLDDPDRLDWIVQVGGGKYFLEVFPELEDPEDLPCKVPGRVEIDVPGLPQVNFTVPLNFNFCGVYELVPAYDRSLNLEFSLQLMDDPTAVAMVGTSFTISQPGKYTLVGRNLDMPEEVCPRIAELTVGNLEPAIFTPTFIEQDCQGNMVWDAGLQNYAPNQVNIKWIAPNGDVVSTGARMFPVIYGEYRLEVQPRGILGNCPENFKNFTVSPPVLSTPTVLSATPLCPFGPESLVSLDADFDNIGKIRWRYLNPTDGIRLLAMYEDSREIVVTQPGIYEVTVFNSRNITCEIGRATILVEESTDLVDFKVPDSPFRVCEAFDWTPETSQELLFTLTRPDGTVVTKNTGESFSLDMGGTYKLRGERMNEDLPFCPRERSFEVIIVQPVPFQIEFVSRDCEGAFTYMAAIGAVLPTEVEFSWRNSQGELVGDEQFFTTDQGGIYSLEVQPANSTRCELVPKPFQVEIPILSLDVRAFVDVFCPDASFTVISLQNPVPAGFDVKWYFLDQVQGEIYLPLFDSKQTIEVLEEGLYTVRVTDDINCLLGSDEIIVLKSTDGVRPMVLDSYVMCSEYEAGETIQPGSFSAYIWSWEGQVMSRSSSYKPLLAGTWTLRVTSFEGCDYAVDFEVIEDCELRIKLPNAMIPGDPIRSFTVYTNFLVDELEVWVFNKWGQVVFTCSEKNLTHHASACTWDGFFQDQKLPAGAYAVRLVYKNVGEQIQKTMLTTVTVIN